MPIDLTRAIEYFENLADADHDGERYVGNLEMATPPTAMLAADSLYRRSVSRSSQDVARCVHVPMMGRPAVVTTPRLYSKVCDTFRPRRGQRATRRTDLGCKSFLNLFVPRPVRNRRADIRNGALELVPAKTSKSSGAKLSIAIEGELEAILRRITERPRKVTSLRLIQRESGKPVTLQMIQRRWQNARAAAGIPASEAQFRDLRAKAATDIDLDHAQDLLAHSSRTTTEGYRRGRKGKRVNAVNHRIGSNTPD